MTSERRPRIRSRGPARARRLRLASLAAILSAFPSWAPATNLPTPCAGAACGTNPTPTPFVTSGQIGNGGMPVINGTTMTIQQLSDKAILNWKDFNIGAGHGVVFQQPAATSAALNRIWSADPSVIAGRLSANGQVFLLNQSGIVFDQGAQVNVGSLLASTLNLTDKLFLDGILSANGGFRGVGLPPVLQAGTGAVGAVTVEQGATLTTTSGGRVFLFGRTAENRGTIDAPDGQVILGAGKTIYLAASTDPAMRGLLIQVDASAIPAPTPASSSGTPPPPTGSVDNRGTITAARGNVTLAGLMVNQSGRVRATTSVGANGSVFLVAGDTSRKNPADASGQQPYQFLNVARTGFGRLTPNNGGTLKLASGSVTEVVPDVADTGTVTDQQAFLRSTVQLVGRTITAESGSAVLAPSGTVSFLAAENPIARQLFPGSGVGAPANSSRIYLADGAIVDTSGLEAVSLPVERTLIQVELRGNELQDAPLLRNGFLRGKTITVNVNTGTTLTDIAPFRANIARGVSERSTAGGDIRLESEGDVITRSGSSLDVSGGSIAYRDGFGSTTKLLGADGRAYDVTTAPLDVQYVGFAGVSSVTNSKWGATTRWDVLGGSRGLPLAGYTEGADAGTITIIAPQAALRGSLTGSTVAGLYQRDAATLPSSGRFVLGDAAGLANASPLKDLRAPGIRMVGTVGDLPADFTAQSALSATDRDTIFVSSTGLERGGFGRVELYGNGLIAFDQTAPLRLAPGGSLTAIGRRIALDGRIDGPGGPVQLRTRFDLVGPALPGAGDIVLGPDAAIVTRGGWINDSLAYERATGRTPALVPILIDGGDVTLGAAGSVRLLRDDARGARSFIDASGGAWLDANAKLRAGDGGDVALLANNGVTQGAVSGGVTLVSGQVRSAGLSAGGRLTIASAYVRVEGSPGTGAGNVSDPDPELRAFLDKGGLVLGPAFFTEGGFSDYRITGNNGVSIVDGTAIRPLMRNLFFARSAIAEASGSDLYGFVRRELVDLGKEFRRAASVSFTATSTGEFIAGAGRVRLGEGTSITTDPGASVTLGARTYLDVLGRIEAPAGTISLLVAPGVSVGVNDKDEGFLPGQQLLIGANAVIAARAFDNTTDTLNPLHYRQGEVLAGGRIDVVATKGSVKTEAGSLIDVSGTSAVVDIQQFGSGKGAVIPTRVSGAAGSINIQAREGITLAGKLDGHSAGTPGSAGGSLLIGLDRYDRSDNPNAEVRQDRLFPTGTRVLRLEGVGARDPGAIPNGFARIDQTIVSAGGFDVVTLRSTDEIRLAGSVTLATRRGIVVDAPVLAAEPGASAHLSGSYVFLGNVNAGNQPGAANTLQRVRTPIAGDGVLQADAELITWRGNGTLTGFATVSLASSGDIRLTHSGGDTGTDFTGSIRTTADIVFRADRIFPTTYANFTINPPGSGATAYVGGRLTVLPGGPSGVPLAAGGSLTINARSIDQRGVLRSPLGEITLNASESIRLAEGSLTSVSAEGKIIPFGATQNGRDWTYQVDVNGSNAVVGAPPVKGVSLSAPDIALAARARIDLSGGGDLYAYEFVAGPGGSIDVLDPANHVYAGAILPQLGPSYGPRDHQYALGSSVQTGEGIYLSGIPGLPAGFYPLLPARYALLPGAFAVQRVRGYTDIPAGSTIALPDGSAIAAGRQGYVGTDIVADRTSGYRLTPASVVRTQSGYNDSTGSSFFATSSTTPAGARLPADAGQLVLAASASLNLDSAIVFDPARYALQDKSAGQVEVRKGRGGEFALVAPRIAVVDEIGDSSDSLQVTAGALNRLGAESLLIGARRTTTATGDALTVGASRVVIDNSDANPLSAPELIIAATERISLAANSVLENRGAPARDPGQLQVSGDGAVVRLSGGPLATVVRAGVPQNPAGVLAIETGAALRAAGGSILLDATANTTVAPGAIIAARGASFASNRISIGDAPEDAAGLRVTPALLDILGGLQALTLRSAGSIDFFGAASLGGAGPTGAPVLASLTLDGAAIRGFGAGDKTVRAAEIRLDGPVSVTCGGTACLANGSGKLVLDATGAEHGRVVFGRGEKVVSGFSAVEVQARSIVGDGKGSLSLDSAGALLLTATRLGTTDGADLTVSNPGSRIVIGERLGGAPEPLVGIGGRLQLIAGDIEQRGLIELPGGALTLQATGGGGDVLLAAGSRTLAQGVMRELSGNRVFASAGDVTLASQSGSVRLLEGAVVDISGASDGARGGDAGTLSVRAPNGDFVPGGSVLAAATSGQRRGGFSLDSGALESFSALNAFLTSAALSGEVDIRVRTGEVVIAAADTVKAARFQLTADNGGIDLSGTLDTRGAGGGAVALWARNDVNVLPGANIDTRSLAADGHGGNVVIGSVAGFIALNGNAAFDLRGSSSGLDGQVTLRAARTADGLDVNVRPLAATINSDRPVIVEGVRTYTVGTANTTATIGGVGNLDQGNLDISTPVDGSPGSAIYQDTQAFAGAASAIANRLGNSGRTVQVRAGIEVASPGNLRLASTLDLRSASVEQQFNDDGELVGVVKIADLWRVNDLPPNITFRAAGDLVVGASLSDGFLTPASGLVASLTQAGGDSAAYRLAAGADLGSANPLGVRAAVTGDNGGNFILTPGNLVRTGTGRIEIAAGGDVRLGYNPATASYTSPNAQAAVVYTAGQPTATPAGFPATVDRSGNPLPVEASFPTGGGDIDIRAQRDVVAAPSQQLTSDWQWRRGAVNPATGAILSISGRPQNPAWWIVFDRFAQGVGTLGGGDIRVRAGRDVTNLSAVAPTNGRVTGNAGEVPQASQVLVQGGGDVDVDAGRDVRSGVFEVDRGNARLRAGSAFTNGRVVGDTNPPDRRVVYPVLVLGDGTIDVQARGDVTVQTAVNGTALPATVEARSLLNPAYFYTYSAEARVALSSVDGDIRLDSGALALQATRPNGLVDTFTNFANLLVYPPQLTAKAISGGIDVGRLQLFPSAHNTLTLLARDDVRLSGAIQMYDADVARVANPLRPVGSLDPAPGSGSFGIYLDTVPVTPVSGGATLPLAGTDSVTMVSEAGSIVGNGNTVVLTKSARVQAGLDITNLRLVAKNLTDTDVTRIEAGRDIRYDVKKDQTGSNRLVANNNGIRVGGPGQVQVLAGGDIDLGNSAGIMTRGNLDDVRLPAGGATLLVGAGFGRTTDGALRQPALDAFVDRYVVGLGTPPRLYGTDLQRFMAQRTGNPDISAADALATFRALPADVRLSFVTQVLYQELDQTGLDHNRLGASFGRGYTAITTLFPQNGYRGDVNLFFSQIKTEQGGDIQFLVPGGALNVGLTSPPTELNELKIDRSVRPPIPAAANLGILVTAAGAVRGFAKGDIMVNRARILTLRGGDILLWSSGGNIDAGRGAKTASAAPPPVIQTDDSGNVFVNPSGAVSGSGIGQLLTVSGLEPGSVSLIAPLGEVNAGDAGIRVAGNLNIAALRVVGADNIQVGGTSSGVPVSNVGALSGALSGANTVTDAGKNAVEQMTRDMVASTAQSNALGDAFKPSFLTVKLLCIGSECTPTFIKN